VQRLVHRALKLTFGFDFH